MPVTLIINPHLDDETISCGGLIQQRKLAGHEVVVLTMHTRGYDYNRRDGWREEFEDHIAVKEYLGFSYQEGPSFKEGEPGFIGYYKLLEWIEQQLRKWQPIEVVIPASDDLNQDHRHLHHVCQIALRPVNLGSVKRVLEFIAIDGVARQPNYFIPLSEDAVSRKVAAMALYRQESRTIGPRAPVNLIAQARVWGAMCGSELAEGYRLHFSRE